jgi:hypothetical protein
MKMNLTSGPNLGGNLTEEQKWKLWDHMLQFSRMFHGEFQLSYGEFHASLQNEKKNVNHNFKQEIKLVGKV